MLFKFSLGFHYSFPSALSTIFILSEETSCVSIVYNQYLQKLLVKFLMFESCKHEEECLLLITLSMFLYKSYKSANQWFFIYLNTTYIILDKN